MYFQQQRRQAFQTYDATNAALNWSFLATQNPPITPDNSTTTFRPRAITLQQDAIDTSLYGNHGLVKAERHVPGL